MQSLERRFYKSEPYREICKVHKVKFEKALRSLPLFRPK
ncbi:hypothetical protein N480_09865 [Pseudoalteromonas luteoviolacea S2607]|uniref:Uncharacterized protein n=1 Tax=Pseudoalteromonas luteoviolacea S4060-1 TaxID=1365257 RepID=A0A167LZM4_9GAMM|nr:hypothetical protein N480_09865 [Pseudoalteromonas luteoviolacea S2607]KZN65572.1 hypothetical protein N478_20960 [Pseudoalteromonas luteoviolacea S4060-1]